MNIFRETFEKIKLRKRADRYRNKLDKGEIQYLLSAIANGQTVMDIGAHKAGYTYWMVKKAGNSGKIYAFEPQKLLYEYIQHIKTIYKWDNVHVENLALSDNASSAILYIPVNNVRASSSPGATIVEEMGHQFIGSTEVVHTESLDSYCNRSGLKPDFLKIDVEGNELKIFRGGINILQTCKPKILVEIESRHVGEKQVLETFEFLISLGYTGHFIHNTSHVPIGAFEFEKHQNQEDMNNYCNNFVFE
ncbi:MAG: FkbM family methyltransferase [Bacteroidales bacterium]